MQSHASCLLRLPAPRLAKHHHLHSSMSDADRQARRPLRLSAHHRHHVTPPPHHVVSRQDGMLDFLPSLPPLFPSAPEQLYPSEQTSVFAHAGPRSQGGDIASLSNSESKEEVHYTRTGFRNPWPSWHTPYLSEVWNGLHWGSVADDEGGDEEEGVNKPAGSERAPLLAQKGEDEEREPDLRVVSPSFEGNVEGLVQATWLGHASILVQLPPLSPSRTGRPLRVLFDPIFSLRCSPTQYFGPMRHYPPPCSIAALPEIDVVLISHSHYDHLDYDSIVELWRANADHLRFIVPLGNRDWFLGMNLGIGEDRVTELDWWDEAWLDQGAELGTVERTETLRVVCTPAQHGSGRYGLDSSRSLWSSWTLEHICQGQTFRIFFGGDTGFQFHSPASQPDAGYPTCPAFAEVAKHIGTPDLSFLPISVGATFSFVKSYDPIGIIPQLDDGVTGANHMTPRDAVRVSKIMVGLGEGRLDEREQRSRRSHPPVAVAIHWGTFVNDSAEVDQSMRDLRSACHSQGVDYVRSIDERAPAQKQGDSRSSGQGHSPSPFKLAQPPSSRADLIFACLDHGQSIYLPTGSQP